MSTIPHLTYVPRNDQENNEAPGGAEHPGTHRQRFTALPTHHANIQAINLATDSLYIDFILSYPP